MKTAAIIIIVSLLTFGVALAITHWSQSLSWTMESFTVSGASTSVDLGIVSVGDTHQETYTVTNNGNVPVDVQVTTVGNGYTEAWNATTATIPVGNSAGFMLTLTINGVGSCTVNIDAV